jgi:hypothetical protein
MDAKEYFEPSTIEPGIDRAALIVALLYNRESSTRTDYAHPRITQIVQILQAARNSPNSSNTPAAGTLQGPDISLRRASPFGSPKAPQAT